jgi:hypothetical protein
MAPMLYHVGIGYILEWSRVTVGTNQARVDGDRWKKLP